MCGRRSSVPPVPRPPPPPVPPILPPAPSASGSAHGARSIVSSKSKTKSKTHEKRHVTFDSGPAKSSATHAGPNPVSGVVSPPSPPPPPPPPPGPLCVSSALPQNVSGEVFYQQIPTFEVKTDSNDGAGYIRVQGGLETTRWHTYDFHVPSNEFLTGNAHQQANLINVLLASQLGGLMVNNSPGQIKTHDTGLTTKFNGNHSTICAPVPGPSTALTAANLQRVSSKGSTHAAAPNALTSVSRRPIPTPVPPPPPPSPTHVPYMISEATSGSTVSCAHHRDKNQNRSRDKRLKCFNCGEVKKNDEDNVKEISGTVPICWKCLVLVDSRNAVRKWIAACA